MHSEEFKASWFNVQPQNLYSSRRISSILRGYVDMKAKWLNVPPKICLGIFFHISFLPVVIYLMYAQWSMLTHRFLTQRSSSMHGNALYAIYQRSGACSRLKSACEGPGTKVVTLMLWPIRCEKWLPGRMPHFSAFDPEYARAALFQGKNKIIGDKEKCVPGCWKNRLPRAIAVIQLLAFPMALINYTT